MTDTDKLKRLAEMLHGNGHVLPFGVRPDEILALIAENERLKAVSVKRAASIVDLVMERDDAVALLRHCYEEPMEPWHEVSAFLARIDAAD